MVKSWTVSAEAGSRSKTTDLPPWRSLRQGLGKTRTSPEDPAGSGVAPRETAWITKRKREAARAFLSGGADARRRNRRRNPENRRRGDCDTLCKTRTQEPRLPRAAVPLILAK